MKDLFTQASLFLALALSGCVHEADILALYLGVRELCTEILTMHRPGTRNASQSWLGNMYVGKYR